MVILNLVFLFKRSFTIFTKSLISIVMNSGKPMWSAQTQVVNLRSRAIFTKSLTCLIAAVLMFSNSVFAQTATEIEAPITNLTIGTQLKAPSKVLLSLEETLTQCMGKVSEKALENHPTFESYWKASQNSRRDLHWKVCSVILLTEGLLQLLKKPEFIHHRHMV